MKNLIIPFFAIILSSCFGDSQIIIDEEKIKSGDENILNEEFNDRAITNTEDITNTETRNILELDGNFSSEDIETTEDLNLVGSGVRSYSSEYAKQIIKETKNADSDLSFIVYFGFDSDSLDAKAQDIINKHIAILAKYPRLDLRLEGHTDEKGTREYNLSLGELRAISVREALDEEADIVSFGEEKPASSSDDLNRRVEFIYK